MTCFKIIAFSFGLLSFTGRVFAQSDTASVEITKDNFSCIYVIDKVWTDKNSPYKRVVNGAVNFFEIQNGQINVAARTPKHSFVFSGIVDSVETISNKEGNGLKVFATTSYGLSTNRAAVFEVVQSADSTLMIHYYPVRTLGDYFFSIHFAEPAEVEQIHNYFLDNKSKY